MLKSVFGKLDCHTEIDSARGGFDENRVSSHADDPPSNKWNNFVGKEKKKQEKSCPVIDGCYSQRPDAEYERLRSSISIPSIAFHNNWSNRSTGEILEDRVRRSGVTSKTKQTAHDRVSRSVAITHDTNCEVSDGLLESFK